MMMKRTENMPVCLCVFNRVVERKECGDLEKESIAIFFDVLTFDMLVSAHTYHHHNNYSYSVQSNASHAQCAEYRRIAGGVTS